MKAYYLCLLFWKVLKDSINDGSSGITNVTAEVVGSGLFLHGTSAKV